MTAILGVTTDAELVHLARGGDADAFSELFDRHRERVTAACRTKTRSKADADDAVQEAFAKAFANLGRLREPAQFGAWVRSIAVRACMDQHRAARRVVVLDHDSHLDVADGAPLPDETLERRERDAAIRSALDTLGERDRHALYLRHIAEAPVSAVADELGLTEGSTRVMLTRARERLRLIASGLGSLIPLPWRQWFRDNVGTATPALEALTMVVAVGLASGMTPADTVARRAVAFETAAFEAIVDQARPAKQQRVAATRTPAPRPRPPATAQREAQQRTQLAPSPPFRDAGAVDRNEGKPHAPRENVLEPLDRVDDSVQVQRRYPDDEETDELIDVTVFSEDQEHSTRLYADNLDEAREAAEPVTAAVEDLTGSGGD